jgi:hypothetical protein
VEQVPEQRRLAAAEESGDQHDGELGRRLMHRRYPP